MPLCEQLNPLVFLSTSLPLPIFLATILALVRQKEISLPIYKQEFKTKKKGKDVFLAFMVVS